VWKEIDVGCIIKEDPQLTRLAEVIAEKVGQQRFHVWFNSSTRLDLKPDMLEICVPNDFISEWIGSHFSRLIQEAAQEVLGGPLHVRFSVMPQLFDARPEEPAAETRDALAKTHSGFAHAKTILNGTLPPTATHPPVQRPAPSVGRARLRHSLDTFVVGASNQLAYNAAAHVAQYPGSQYTPLFIHGSCGLGKTHLLQGICRRFLELHPTRRWAYMTGEEFTNEFVQAMRMNKIDQFRHRMRELDLLVIDDVHFLAGKRATMEEFLHTFNAIEAMGKQVVMASDSHPKTIEDFGESLINRFVSGMVVRIDPPNFQMRCEMLRRMALEHQLTIADEVICWIARRVTQNVRELEGAITRVAAYSKLSNRPVDEQLAHEALGDLERQHVQPIRPDAIVQSVCDYFGVAHRDLLSARRDHGISLPRSVAMYLVRKMSTLSYPEIGQLLNKRNHSTVISACRRIDRAITGGEALEWSSALGTRKEDAAELLQRLEEHCRAGK